MTRMWCTCLIMGYSEITGSELSVGEAERDEADKIQMQAATIVSDLGASALNLSSVDIVELVKMFASSCDEESAVRQFELYIRVVERIQKLRQESNIKNK